MEENNIRKTLGIALLFLFFLLSQIPTSSSQQRIHTDPTLSQTPTPSPPFHPPLSSTRASLRPILLGILLGSLTGAFSSIIFLFLIRLFVLVVNRTPILKGPVTFSPKISPKALKSVISVNVGSPQILGSFPNGKYLKLALDSQVTVAVKVFESIRSNGAPRSSSSWKRRVQRELELLAKVNHRNVMSLRAYIQDRDRLSLVFDYSPNGSLHDAMKRVRSDELQLGWESRLRIAVGMVKGLKYLHFECSPRILHYNLKPSNVLLDESFEPKLADCGLERLLPAGIDASFSSSYVPPESFQSCRYTDKSDIYSFGLILGLLLTGRDPSDPFFATAAGLGGLDRWLRHLQQAGDARDALDRGISREGEEEEMLMAIRIALVCMSDLPADRPSSDELEAMLTQLHSF